MKGKCKWVIRYKEYGRYKYSTECGSIALWQRNAVYCPFCGRIIARSKEIELMMKETMMPASEAKNESKNRGQVDKIKDELAKGIEKAIQSGEFSTSCQIHAETSESVRTMLKKELEDLGYHVSITNNKKESGDQIPFLDNINISWE